MQDIPIVAVVGRKNSGKTTLITKLIPELTKRGIRVGTVKHDAHDYEIDKEGKDSWKHKKSGARQVLVASSKKVAFIKSVDIEEDLREMVKRYFTDIDLVITEGYKRFNIPKIEVYRSKISKEKEPIFLQSKDLLAIVSDQNFENVMSLGFNDIEKIVNRIKSKVMEV